ncbi:urease accessory protein UreE [Paroceanicella profunda]|uniref:Urease accessory protein UreE n=1 Tax=Paroceanicella profunda TaxID=2579971 RepID=A0A5B8FUH7_9RHOB|nr:urease accessory protein UreE [Paroceanicella profunda]QDL90864.1 urease accessory protein UreE [Paroceanicella profunda]
MNDFGTAHDVARAGTWQAVAADHVVLDYGDRLLRRRRLLTAGGGSVLVDLAETLSLDAGDAFRLADGRFIEIVPAEEDLLVVRAPDGALARLAWHIGNRHTPCEVGPGTLHIRADHVMEDMLRRLGATLEPLRAPFTPEGGAYGTGRVMGHDHGHSHGSGAAEPAPSPHGAPPSHAHDEAQAHAADDRAHPQAHAHAHADHAHTHGEAQTHALDGHAHPQTHAQAAGGHAHAQGEAHAQAADGRPRARRHD